MKPITLSEHVSAPTAPRLLRSRTRQRRRRVPDILKNECSRPGPVKKGTQFKETPQSVRQERVETMEVTVYRTVRR